MERGPPVTILREERERGRDTVERASAGNMFCRLVSLSFLVFDENINEKGSSKEKQETQAYFFFVCSRSQFNSMHQIRLLTCCSNSSATNKK